jgi:predicted metal-dependent HD superfamily phosphohydrolase
MDEHLYKQVEKHVKGLFENNPQPNLTYHNLEHTKTVVDRVLEIAVHYQLSDKEMFAVFTAAWFHDTGHLFTDLAKHEEKSIALMKEFMEKESTDKDLINDIANCILATHFPPTPANRLQEIIADADTYHFGTKDFKRTNKLVKQEMILRNYNTIVHDWEENTLNMLEQHKFYTPYCQVLLDEGKKKNIQRLKSKQLKKTTNNSYNKLFNEEKDSQQEKTNQSLITKGIQTMLRLTSSNHFKLSEMADSKAHILISVNAIVISITITFLLRAAGTSDRALYPATVFLVFALATIIVAILATRPKVTEGVFKKENVLNKQINLLFFGNFYKSTLDEYQWAMSTIMKDHEYLYSLLVQDIHQLGVVLGRKYKLIRLAYNIFMVGLVLSVVTFLITAFFLSNNDQVVIVNGAGSPL